MKSEIKQLCFFLLRICQKKREYFSLEDKVSLVEKTFLECIFRQIHICSCMFALQEVLEAT